MAYDEEGPTTQRSIEKGKNQTIIYKILHRKLQIEQQESHKTPVVKSRVLKELTDTYSNQFLFRLWHPSCYFCQQFGGKS